MSNNYEKDDRSVHSFWRNDDYEGASHFLRPMIDTCQAKGDWECWSHWVFMLYHTQLLADHSADAERLLIESLEVFPAFNLCRTLALHFWRYNPNIGKAIEIVLRFIRQDNKDAKNNKDIIMAYNLLARLYTATHDAPSAIASLATALSLLPPFSPPLGYLFDFDAIYEMYNAGLRHEVMTSYIHKIEDYQFIISDYHDEFLRVKDELAKYEAKTDKEDI